MSAVSLAETSESSLFAKVDIYWYPEKDYYFLDVESMHVLVFCCCFFVLYFYLYSIRLTSFIIGVPRPLSNFFCIIYSKG